MSGARVSRNDWKDLIHSEHGPEKSTDRNVLAVIARYMRADGYRAFPSQETIAKQAHLSVRQVKYSIQRVERDGWILRERGRRPKGQDWFMNYYTATVNPPLLAVLREWEQARTPTKGPAGLAAPAAEGGAGFAPPIAEGGAKSDRRWCKNRQKVVQDLHSNSYPNSYMNKERPKDVEEAELAEFRKRSLKDELRAFTRSNAIDREVLRGKSHERV